MTGDLAVASGPLAATEEQETLLASAQVNGQVEKFVRCRRLGDLDVRACASLDELVAERFHPAMAVLAQQLLECVPLEALRSDSSSDANIHKQGRLEASAVFHSIDSFDKLGRMISPTVIAPREDCCLGHSGSPTCCGLCFRRSSNAITNAEQVFHRP